MLATLALAGLIIWIIKDHNATMAELRTIRDNVGSVRYKQQYKT